MTSDCHKKETLSGQFSEDILDIDTHLLAVFNNIGDPIFVKDAEYKLLFVNDAFCSIFGLPRNEIIGTTLAEKIPRSEMEHFLSIDRQVFEEGKEILCEETLSPIGSAPKVILTRKNRFTDLNGRHFLVGVIHDITERKQAEEKLKLAASVFSHALEGIMITDADGTIVEVNDSFSRMNGYTREEVLGKNLRILQSGRQSPEFYRQMWDTLLAEGNWRGEVSNRHKNGEVYVEMLTVSAVKNETGQVQRYVSLSTDITQIKVYQGQLEHCAHYDVLTNLPNRVLLADRLSQAMAQCQRHNRSLAVAFMDLDGFKEINDNHGHKVGDDLLIEVSQRMKSALRECDTLARIGGDEFIAVMVDLEKTEDCVPILERLLKFASEPITLVNIQTQVSVSIGIAFYSQDGVDADQLICRADQAMYSAKKAGKNRYHRFNALKY